MSENSNIEWTDATWITVTGCERVSPGCQNCYSERLSATRLAHTAKYAGVAEMRDNGEPRWTGKIMCHEDALAQPLKWKKPRRVFVNSMSDTFHEDVPDYFIAAIFGVMAACPLHTFQILTKRPQLMCDWAAKYCKSLPPLSNVWLGTSVEDQQRADERIPWLLKTPAAVRFLSCEPLLGPIYLTAIPHIHWVIVGGESGPGARPCDLRWIRSLIEQCKAADVPCFVKQLGSHLRLKDSKGGDIAEWPDDLRVREFPLAIGAVA